MKRKQINNNAIVNCRLVIAYILQHLLPKGLQRLVTLAGVLGAELEIHLVSSAFADRDCMYLIRCRTGTWTSVIVPII